MSAPRLSAETKAAIVVAYANGENTARIAKRFGVDPSYPTLLAGRSGVARRVQSRGLLAPTVRWVLARARRRQSEARIEDRAARRKDREARRDDRTARRDDRETKLREAMAALDEKARPCLDRCRSEGLSLATSLSLAQDDQAARRKVAA